MSIRQKAIDGGKWLTVSTVISTVLQFVQVSVLARLLEPSAFGVVSVSTLLVNFFSIFSNLGFSNSIIYKQESDRRTLSSLYFMSLALGLLSFGIVYFSTPLAVAYYKDARLTPVIRLAALYFPIVYLGQIYYFILQKELQFKALATIDIAGACAGVIVAVALAYSGYEETSLVVGQLAGQAVRLVLSVAQGWRYFVPVLYFNYKRIDEHVRFGVYSVGDVLLSYMQTNVDNIIVGGTLGVSALGYYTIAYQLAIFPMTRLNPIILQVAYPLIVKLKEDAEGMKRSYVQILDLVSFMNLPLLAGLFITADSVVPLIYGPKWNESIELIRIFVFVSAISCVAHPFFTIAFAKGKPKLAFYLNLITLAIKVPLIYIFAQYAGLTGIAVAYLVTMCIAIAINFLLVHSLIGNFFGAFLANFIKPVLFCLTMVLVVYLYKHFVGYEGLGHTLAQIALGGAVFLALTLRFKMSLADIKGLRQAV